jgi:hypothetical protein
MSNAFLLTHVGVEKIFEQHDDEEIDFSEVKTSLPVERR